MIPSRSQFRVLAIVIAARGRASAMSRGALSIIAFSQLREFRQFGGECHIMIAKEMGAPLAPAALNLTIVDHREGPFICECCLRYCAHPCKARMDITLETFYIASRENR